MDNKDSKPSVEFTADSKQRIATYFLADIAIQMVDGKPMFWSNHLGYHAGQGGYEFGMGNCGVDDLGTLLKLIEDKVTKVMPDIIRLIEEKEAKRKVINEVEVPPLTKEELDGLPEE